jgi:hypothetical protein
MEAYDLRGEAAGRAATGETQRASTSVAVRLGPAPRGVAFAGLAPGSLEHAGSSGLRPPLEFQRGTGAALQPEARALCRRNVNGNSNSERLR